MTVRNSEPLVLALDHGTSGCKVALVSVQGKVIDFSYEATPMYIFPDGGAEQNPQEWWNAFKKAARTV
jgi:xylulokinase